MRRFLQFILMATLGAAASLPASAQTSPPEPAVLESKLRFAAGQHEIIKILLLEGRFSDVLQEYRKILELDLEAELEPPVVKEAWVIVEQLRKAAQYPLAHALVDDTFQVVESRESKFYLLIMKGKIFHDEGRTREALEAYRKAQEFQD